LNGYYSVFNPRGEKIADCGIEKDAVNLMASRNCRWDGHYFTFNPLPGDIIDVGSSSQKELPTSGIVVDTDSTQVEYVEIGGQKIAIQQLPPNCQEPFIPNLHD
jgi:hypothetical protein